MKKKNIEDYLTQFNITEEYLRDAYTSRQLSLPEIQKEKGIGFKACAKLLRYFNIPVRSISESRKTPVARKKILHTLKEKYNVENPSQLEFVKEKKKKTFLKHYGVDNIWKSKKYYEWLDNYMIKTFGCLQISQKWQNVGQKKHLILKIFQNTLQRKKQY